MEMTEKELMSRCCLWKEHRPSGGAQSLTLPNVDWTTLIITLTLLFIYGKEKHVPQNLSREWNTQSERPLISYIKITQLSETPLPHSKKSKRAPFPSVASVQQFAMQFLFSVHHFTMLQREALIPSTWQEHCRSHLITSVKRRWASQMQVHATECAC